MRRLRKVVLEHRPRMAALVLSFPSSAGHLKLRGRPSVHELAECAPWQVPSTWILTQRSGTFSSG